MRSLELVIAWFAAMRWTSKALSGSRLGQVLMGASMGWRLVRAVGRVRAISWSSVGCILSWGFEDWTGMRFVDGIDNPWQLSRDYI